MNKHSKALLIVLSLLLTQTSYAQKIKALVGGTLLDGFGGPPIQNSVVIIEGKRVKAVGRIGELVIPKYAEIIST
jgi:hypothetical protein